MTFDLSKFRNIISKINYLSLLLFIFWLPLKDDFMPPILALWIFTWLLEGNFKQRLSIFPRQSLYLGLFLFFIIVSLSLFRANDFEYGWFMIQQKLSVVFFPIFLIGANEHIRKNIKTILLVFIFGNMIATLYCLGYNLFDNLEIIDGVYKLNYNAYPGYLGDDFIALINDRQNLFSYAYLSIFKHPSYFSLYINFSIIILYNFLRKKIIRKKWQKILSILTLLFFVLMIYLLQARSGLISFVFTITGIVLLELRRTFKKRFVFLGIILIIGTLIITISNKNLRNKISESIHFFDSGNKEKLINADTRFQLWYTSSIVAKENFWIGTSAANLTDELVEKYKKLGFEGAATEELNAHNQYLESFAGLGILGLLSLLFIMGYCFYLSIKNRHYLLFFLMLILSINFLFESMLNRMAGVLFMMFFLSLFVFMKKPKDEIEQKETDNSLINE